MVRARRLIVPLVLIAAVMAHAGDAEDAAARARQQIAELRTQLANVTLELREAQQQLEAIRDFLKAEDLAATFERWQALRAELAEERRSIRRERVRLEAAREELDRTTQRIADRRAAEAEQAEQRAKAAAEPDWTAQYQMGVIYHDGNELYVKATDGSIFVDADQDIDRRNILVRGTFLNKSAVAWRYTFEIRAGGVERFRRGRRIVGSWRYQTPLLDPGELHEFEVKMPVDDVSHVRVLQIGKVVADRPAQGEDQPRAVAETRRQGEPVEANNRY